MKNPFAVLGGNPRRFAARSLSIAMMALLFSNVVLLEMATAVAGPVKASSPVSIARLPSPAPSTKHAKLGSQLMAVASAAGTGGIADGVRAAADRKMKVSADRVRVVVTPAGSPTDVRDAIQMVGGSVEAEYGNLVQALVPVNALRKLAEGPAVAYVAEPSVPAANQVTDEAVLATNASAWQDAGVTGAGVRVGIVDLGFIGFDSSQSNGDLPATLTTADFGCGGVASGTTHGTAVAEIVHKVAPDAQLYLICIATTINLGQAKDYAIAHGITIVNFSAGIFNTSRGDGSGAAMTPDGIVADARAHGILWVNAAGNSAQEHWSGPFVDSNADQWNEFAAGDQTNSVFVAAGSGFCAFLKWDSWPVTNQDFDLYVADSNNQLVAASENVQNGSQPPTEALCYTNFTGLGQSFGVAVRRYLATSAPRFDLFLDPGAPQYVVPAGSMTEPASSPNAFAAGAICWQNNALEPYSSRGPTIDGRVKPDIAGQDATSSSVFGPSSGCTGGFIGTSASAPHVAGAAALVAQANPSFTPSQIQSFLQGRAVDLGTPGKDNSYGAGRLWLSNLGAPTVVGRSPAANSIASLTPVVTAKFSGSVTGVTTISMAISNVADLVNLPAAVTYDPATRTARLQPSAPLLTGATYRVALSGRITDLVGNPLAWTTWTFTTSAPTTFKLGSHTGYKFNGTGAVVAIKTFTLTKNSAASSTKRQAITNQSGTWLAISSGVWSGYWMRESSVAYLAATPISVPAGSNTSFTPAVSLTVNRGTHTGYKFGVGGVLVAEKTFTLANNSTTLTTARSTSTYQSGKWYFVSSGVWAGYWLRSSDVVHL